MDKDEITKANLVWTPKISKKFVNAQENGKPQLSNHILLHSMLSNKKNLYLNMKEYYKAKLQDPSAVIPLTFHIKSIDDPEIHKLRKEFNG